MATGFEFPAAVEVVEALDDVVLGFVVFCGDGKAESAVEGGGCGFSEGFDGFGDGGFDVGEDLGGGFFGGFGFGSGCRWGRSWLGQGGSEGEGEKGRGAEDHAGRMNEVGGGGSGNKPRGGGASRN